MALNPFFLQGSPGEQRLIQELINEQLKIYGVEVIYIPRKYVRRETIIEEISTSKFDDNFGIEAYINNYEGYSGAGDVLTKFGMSLRDELSLIISKERFEDFIGSFLSNLPESETGGVTARPREGDVIYFPLGKRLFEVKFVEHEKPFYQLGKTYVYELQCELFEYEDEMGGWDNVNTTTEEIDSTLENFGYITTLQLFSLGEQATGTATTSTGYIRRIILSNDGYGYTSTPTVAISTAPVGGTDATAVAITTSINDTYSVKEILLTNAGAGYTTTPTITISGGGGVGAAATCDLVTNFVGINSVTINTVGSGYPQTPTVSFNSPFYPETKNYTVTNDGFSSYVFSGDVTGSNPNITAHVGDLLVFNVNASGHPFYIGYKEKLDDTFNNIIEYNTGVTGSGTEVGTVTWDTSNTEIGISSYVYYCGVHNTSMNGYINLITPEKISSGVGVTASGVVSISTTGSVTRTVLISDAGIGYTSPVVTISQPPVTTGIGTFQFNEIVVGSVSGARGRVKTWDTDTNILKIGTTDGKFVPGDVIVGAASSATYSVHYEVSAKFTDKYEQNDEIEEEADLIVDFTESNPFGNY